MKKITIKTNLRPALPEDVFSSNGNGSILSNKHFVYKSKDGKLSTPLRIQEPEFQINFLGYRKTDYNFFLKKQEEYNKRYHDFTVELFQLMDENRMYVFAAYASEFSIPVHLRLKQVEAVDMLAHNKLISNTVSFLKEENKVIGPLYIKPTAKQGDFRNSILEKRMFVLDPDAVLEEISETEVA